MTHAVYDSDATILIKLFVLTFYFSLSKESKLLDRKYPGLSQSKKIKRHQNFTNC